MVIEPLFTGNDLKLIEALEYNPDLKPGYDLIKSCLVWKDERPVGLTPAGYETLCDVWIARSFIHRGVDFSTDKLDPKYFRDIWNRALNQKFKWPGFKRLALNEEDKAYFEHELQRLAAGEEY